MSERRPRARSRRAYQTAKVTLPQIVREGTKDIRAELTSIRRHLDALAGKVDNIVGLPKEIDHALERITAMVTLYKWRIS
jgi:hypothetical protein